METGGLGQNTYDVVKRLSHQLVEHISPAEAPLFEDFFAEYMKERARRSTTDQHGVVEHGLGVGDSTGSILESDLAFNPQAIQDVITPTVISAVVVGVFKLAELAADRRKSQRSKPQDLDTGNIDFKALGSVLLPILRSWGIGQKRAKQIVDAFLAALAQDPRLVLKLER